MVGQNWDNDPQFSGGKIIQYMAYSKNKIGIILSLSYSTIHSGAGFASWSTNWLIIDMKSKKIIFICFPENCSEEWQAATGFTDNTPSRKECDGFSIEIKDEVIKIKEQEKTDSSAVYTNSNKDFKSGTIYKWQDTSFVKIK